MSIKQPTEPRGIQAILLSDGRTRLKHCYRGPNGPSNVKVTIPAGLTIAERVRAEAALIVKAESRSLKSQCAKFEDAVDAALLENHGAGMPWVYDRVRRELAGPMDRTFQQRFNRYIDRLRDEGKSENTIANHKAVVQRVLNTAWKRHDIETIPVRDFGIRHSFRDRVLSPAERQRLEEVMLKCQSYLYWSIRLAEVRPIRSRSDLWNLTKENLILVGDGAPYIHFTAKKTANRERVLKPWVPLKEHPEIVEYLMHGIPDDCPLLFPHLEGEIASVYDFEGMKKCKWSPMGDPNHYFRSLLENAKICDFHFHDFKRMATTYMIDDEGYSADEILALEFYATRAMIDKCYKKRDAMRVLKR
jgi:integrase